MANDIGQSINTYLLAQTAVKAICADRGSPDVLPKDVLYPAFTYEVDDDVPQHHLGGVSALRMARLQITCYDDQQPKSANQPAYRGTRKRVNELDEAILAALDMQSGTLGGTPVRTIQAQDRISDRDQPADGSDRWRYIVSRDYMIWYIP